MIRLIHRFIGLTLLLGVLIAPMHSGVTAQRAQRSKAQVVDWGSAPAILARIKAPKFPARDFDITRFGAVADDQSDSTDAIRKAIDACHNAGGGRVVVPTGHFIAGAIHLKSNVNLYLSAGATLKFSTNPEKYLPVVYTPFERTECINYSPLLYAF